MKKSKNKQVISSKTYDDIYYKTACSGYEKFFCTNDSGLPKRLSYAITISKLSPADIVLDIGCGRGEILSYCQNNGILNCFGIDYSKAGVSIAKENLEKYWKNENRIFLQIADAKQLPFSNNSFSIIFMLDLVEHLNSSDLETALFNVHRVLKPNGKVIIHTSPNLWYYNWGYPIFRFVQRLRGIKLPVNPRLRNAYPQVHVNEQTPITLNRILKKCGFCPEIQLENTSSFTHESKSFRKILLFLVKTNLLKLILCNDIFAIAQKN